MVRRESAHQNPNSKDWKNQLFRPHTDKVPELETPVAGRAFVGGKRDDGKHAGWKKGHRDQDMQEAKRKELSDDDSLGVSTDSLSDALKVCLDSCFFSTLVICLFGVVCKVLCVACDVSIQYDSYLRFFWCMCLFCEGFSRRP